MPSRIRGIKDNSGLQTKLRHRTFAFKAETVTAEGTFSGYCSVFDNVDGNGEIVRPGAFTESLKRIAAGGYPLPILWQHQSYAPIGGSLVLREDDKGLYTEGELLIADIQQAREAHALMKRQIVRGLSIGYYWEKWAYIEDTGVFELWQLDLREYSVVTFPANEEATVETVKRIADKGRLPSMKEFEEFLCEAGFSNTQAKAITGKGLRKLLDQREVDGAPGQCEADSHVKTALQVLENFSFELDI